jgi:hypothetical protein
VLLGAPLSEQEKHGKELLNDTAFLLRFCPTKS